VTGIVSFYMFERNIQREAVCIIWHHLLSSCQLISIVCTMAKSHYWYTRLCYECALNVMFYVS